MKRVEAIIRPDRFDDVAAILEDEGYSGFTITDVRGHGQSPEKVGEWRGQTYELHVTHKLQIAIIVEDDEVEGVVTAIVSGARTGNVGDGLITVTDVGAVVSIRTGIGGLPTAPRDTPSAPPSAPVSAVDDPGDLDVGEPEVNVPGPELKKRTTKRQSSDQ